MLKLSFIIISFMLAFSISAYKLFESKIKKASKVSIFVPFIASVMSVFVLCALVLFFVIPGVLNKIIVLLLGLSPFIIGKFATYEKENLYSRLQVITVILGAMYIMLI